MTPFSLCLHLCITPDTFPGYQNENPCHFLAPVFFWALTSWKSSEFFIYPQLEGKQHTSRSSCVFCPLLSILHLAHHHRYGMFVGRIWPQTSCSSSLSPWVWQCSKGASYSSISPSFAFPQNPIHLSRCPPDDTFFLKNLSCTCSCSHPHAGWIYGRRVFPWALQGVIGASNYFVTI